jgi:hypothetical protein
MSVEPLIERIEPILSFRIGAREVLSFEQVKEMRFGRDVSE